MTQASNALKTPFKECSCLGILRSFLTPALALTLPLALVGCSDSPPTGVVVGLVSYEGKPIGLGLVSANSESNGRIFRAPILDGQFRLEDIPVGTVQIAILTHQASPTLTIPDRSGTAPTAATPRAPFVRIPRRYSDFNKSGLSVEVLSGEQKHDFSLTEN